jgi:hypothetical protein
MKSYTVVSQSIWNDQKFPYLPAEAQVAWFFLFTHASNKQIGVYKAPLSGLYEEINVNAWWTKPKFDEAIARLEKEDLIAVDRKYLIVGFPKFFSESNPQNFPRNYNQLLHMLKQFASLPACPVLERCFQAFIAGVQLVCKRFGKLFPKQLEDSLINCSLNSLTNSSGNCHYIVIGVLNSLLREIEEKKDTGQIRSHPWPEDLALSDKLLAIGKGFKINPHAEFQKAKDWCLANDRQYSDFEAFLRNWFRRASEGRKA